MNLRISKYPYQTHVRKGDIESRLAEAKLVVTDMPKGVEVEGFFDPQCGNEEQSLKLHFAWVEASSEDLYPADVVWFLRERGWVCADASIGAELVRFFWFVLPHVLVEGGEFALLGQVNVTGGGVFYATIRQGEKYTRVLGTRSVHDQFPNALPVLVYRKG